MSKSKTRKRVITGLLSASGAVLAFFAVRKLMAWMQGRQEYDNTPFQRRMQSMVMDAQTSPIGQSDPHGSQAFSSPVEGTRYQPQSQPDRQPIPATGVTAEQVSEMTEAVKRPEHMDIDGLVDPLVQYLMSFHSMINMVRSRRQDNKTGNRSLTSEDQMTFQEAVERLEDSVSVYQPGDFALNSLEGRIYRLSTKVRDALQSMDYTDDDLFRINGEVRSEACGLLRQIQPDQSAVDLDLVRQIYEC